MKACANPLITVIIPAYNHAEYVKETIQSVLSQTYQNWELIFIDDNSPDNTYQVAFDLLANEKRAILVNKEKNYGLIDSLNAGITKSRGEHVAFLASDDAWESDFLKISVEATLNHPNAIVFSEAIGLKGYFNNPGMITFAEMRKVLLRFNPVVSVGCLYPTKFLKSLVDIDTSLFLEDYYIRWMSVFSGLNYYATTLPLVMYRRPSNSMSNDYKKIIMGRKYLFEKIKSNLTLKEKITYKFNILKRNLKTLLRTMLQVQR